jgi:hypothetical protein
MRTTLNIDGDLLQKAERLTGIKETATASWAARREGCGRSGVGIPRRDDACRHIQISGSSGLDRLQPRKIVPEPPV